MAQYFYVRVSTADQNEARQLDAIANLNISSENIFMDKLSGKDFNRPSYKSLVERLQSGDLLYVLSIDRLGRNYEEIQKQWRIITKDIGADVVVLDMPLLDTRREKNLLGTFIADLVLQVLSFCAESERTNTKTRQAAGIAAARARGKHLGRPTKKPPKDFANLVKHWEHKEIPLQKVLDECGGICAATFYNWLRELRTTKDSKQ
jgi:DNA invertase Pin-like site-specific DNA recombinase